MSDRAEFEKQFPMPYGVFWDVELSQYEPRQMDSGPNADEYHRMWQVWKAARANGTTVPMKRIAESKVRQLGGDVCGVLVRKDGRLAAVDEHGRVQWLQSGQGAEMDEVYLPFGAASAYADAKGAGKDNMTISCELVVELIDEIYRLNAHPRPAQQGSVPEGWKLVPVEPTATMISAFEHAPCAENYTDAATWAWEAMLDATPQPPQEGSGDE
jgi:hypothetical protein